MPDGRLTLGERIHAAMQTHRDENGKTYTRDSLALALGTTRQVVIDWIKDRHKPSPPHARGLERLLEIPYGEIRTTGGETELSLGALHREQQRLDGEIARLNREVEWLNRRLDPPALEGEVPEEDHG